MRNSRTLLITEVALGIALAAVLNFLQIRLPISIMGGSINLSMLPIALVAIRRGPIAGMVAGTAFGLLDLLIEPFILVPVQVLLDYPLPYLLFGFGVGLFSKLYGEYTRKEEARLTKRTVAQGSIVLVIALVFGGLLRLIPHVLSGVFFFAEYAADFFSTAPSFLLFGGPVDSGLNVWVYSTIYNATYLVPSLVCVGICLLIIAPVLVRTVPVSKGNENQDRTQPKDK